jgi:alpha/beta hydrolase family protein
MIHPDVSPATRLTFGLTIALVAAVGVGVRLGAASVATPTITGPIKAPVAIGDPSHDYPYSSAVDDLGKYSYVEEEYFVEGTANRYTTPAMATGTIVDSGHPFKTRVIVRRPTSATKFNGTVVVEWINVTPGHDLDIDWLQAHDYWMRTGYAWVGVSAQRVGVEALKVWNAKRYGALDVTDHGTITNDDLSYDLFAQVAQAVRHPSGINMLPGFRVERVFATGHSQSAGRLATYVNSVHPLAPVFDAVVPHGGGGRIRDDLTNVKVFKLLSETDVINNQASVRQPDTANFRSWEVTGDSHVDTQFTLSSRKLSQRDGNPQAPALPGGAAGRVGAGRAGAGGRGAGPAAAAASTTAAAAPRDQGPPQGAMGTNTSPCDRAPYSHVPFYHVMNAAFDHLVRWVKDGTPPPSAPPIQTSEAGPPAVIVRDARGNGLGGIRLAELAVPTGINTGQNSGPGFCRLYGSHYEFDAATLASLYPTHASYVAAVKKVTEDNLKSGYILKADVDATIAAAEKAEIGGK